MKIRIRSRKEDSAFVYAILESHEGITSYSTVDYRPGDPFRDIMLTFTPDFRQEVDVLLNDLGDLIIRVES